MSHYVIHFYMHRNFAKGKRDILRQIHRKHHGQTLNLYYLNYPTKSCALTLLLSHFTPRYISIKLNQWYFSANILLWDWVISYRWQEAVNNTGVLTMMTVT